ncbi:hypothetical protein BKA80DRAFT_258736 [Phyllosticta citrichinensis]
MSTILSSLQSLMHSLLSLIADAFNSVYSIIQTIFATVAAFVGGLVGLTADTAGFFISKLPHLRRSWFCVFVIFSFLESFLFLFCSFLLFVCAAGAFRHPAHALFPSRVTC